MYVCMNVCMYVCMYVAHHFLARKLLEDERGFPNADRKAGAEPQGGCQVEQPSLARR